MATGAAAAFLAAAGAGVGTRIAARTGEGGRWKGGMAASTTTARSCMSNQLGLLKRVSGQLLGRFGMVSRRGQIYSLGGGRAVNRHKLVWQAIVIAGDNGCSQCKRSSSVRISQVLCIFPDCCEGESHTACGFGWCGCGTISSTGALPQRRFQHQWSVAMAWGSRHVRMMRMNAISGLFAVDGHLCRVTFRFGVSPSKRF